MPQAWFLHFYLLGCCCNAAVLLSYVITVDAAAWTPKMVLAQADAQALFVRVVYWLRSLLAFPMSCWPP